MMGHWLPLRDRLDELAKLRAVEPAVGVGICPLKRRRRRRLCVCMHCLARPDWRKPVRARSRHHHDGRLRR